MPITISLDENDETIIRSQMSGNWTWEEYHEATDEILALANSVDHRVDLITTLAEDAVFPSGVAQPHISRMRKLRPDNFKMIVVVRPDPFAKIMIESVNRATQVGSDESVIVQTLEEAYAVVRADRAND